MQKNLLKQLRDIGALIVTLEDMVKTSIEMDEAVSAEALIKVNDDIGKLMIKINESMINIEGELAAWKKNRSIYPPQVSEEIEKCINTSREKFKNLLKSVSQRGNDIASKRKILISVLEKIKTNKKGFQGYRITPRRAPRIIQTDI